MRLIVVIIIGCFRTAGSVIGAGAQSLLKDWDKTMVAVGGLSLLALGVYSAKASTSVTARYIEARLGILYSYFFQSSFFIIFLQL